MALITAGTLTTLGTVVAATGAAATIASPFIKAGATKKAGRDAAAAQTQQQNDALQEQRDETARIQRSLDTFSYTNQPTNAFSDLTNYFGDLDNNFSDVQNSYQNVQNQYANLENTYSNLENQFSGLETNLGGLDDPYAGLTNPFEDVSNPFAGQQVAQQSIDFQQEQQDQQLANILDVAQQGGGVTASTATALARQAGDATRQLAGQIEQQEVANQQRFAQAELQRQTNIAQGAQTLGLTRAGAAQQRNIAAAQAQDQFAILSAQGATQIQQLQAQQAAENQRLSAQGQTAIDFATAGADLTIQQQQAQEQARLDSQSATGATTIQQLQAQDEIRLQETQEQRDADRLELAAAGYSLPGQQASQPTSNPFSSGGFNPFAGGRPNIYSGPRGRGGGYTEHDISRNNYYQERYNSQGNRY